MTYSALTGPKVNKTREPGGGSLTVGGYFVVAVGAGLLTFVIIGLLLLLSSIPLSYSLLGLILVPYALLVAPLAWVTCLAKAIWSHGRRGFWLLLAAPLPLFGPLFIFFWPTICGWLGPRACVLS